MGSFLVVSTQAELPHQKLMCQRRILDKLKAKSDTCRHRHSAAGRLALHLGTGYDHGSSKN
jgi:hypothetical protein